MRRVGSSINLLTNYARTDFPCETKLTKQSDCPRIRITELITQWKFLYNFCCQQIQNMNFNRFYAIFMPNFTYLKHEKIRRGNEKNDDCPL